MHQANEEVKMVSYEDMLLIREADDFICDAVSVETASNYWKKLQAHIAHVQQAGKLLGVTSERIEAHDRSKYSAQEYWAYAQYNHGPNPDPTWFADGWLHHLHHNDHHWQYWIFPDNFKPKGVDSAEGSVMIMPEEAALEMVADWMGASMAYTNSWDMTKWLKEHLPKIRLHSFTAVYVKGVLTQLGYGDLSAVQQLGRVN